MASVQRTYKRNYDSSDTTHFDSFSTTLLTPEECGFTAPTGKIFKEWNTSQDGTGTSYQAGSSESTPTTLYAIWESADITISYAGSQIATMSSSGTKTLLTSGKYCTDNITIAYTKPSGDGAAKENDVNFIDYDGTILYSYSADDFASLTTMPANPSHTGLTAQGWNWTLANAKTYVASYGKLWIGQMYITESGDTEIDVELHAPRLSPWLSLAVNGTLEIDWGDGSTKSTVTGTSTATQNMTPHVYATDGSYTIKIHVVSGSFSLYGTSTYLIFSGNFSNADNNRVYANNIKRVRIGSSLAELKAYAFNSCSSLASITIPSSVTSIGIYAFLNCYALASITIPSGVTSISNYIFQYCDALASIAIPSSVTSIGSYAFSNCYSLASITIPSGVTSIGTYAFASCLSLASITIPSGVTSIGVRVFNNCYALASIAIPSSVTSIGNSAFDFCYSLASITIPSSVTSIGSYAFEKCYALASITIPSSVTSIGSYAFINCRGVGLIRFERTTPPTVATSSTWSNIPTDCIILIPYDSVSYIGATNYPTFGTYRYFGYMASVSGESLPTHIQSNSTNYSLFWYATIEEIVSGTGTQLTQGNGNEIYCWYMSPAGGGSND